jgi:hypothetical protein
MTAEPTRFPVQSYIWESLEATLKAESRRLIRDIAKTLGKDETELARHIGLPNFSAYFVDMTEPTGEKFECTSYSLKGPIQKPCRRPVIFGTTKCAAHTHIQQRPSAALPVYRLLKYYDEDDSEAKTVYLNPATNEILEKESLKIIGSWDSETKTMTLFLTE